MNSTIDIIKFWGLMLAAVLILVFVVPSGCTQPEKATKLLEKSGYTDIEITGWRPFMKSEDEMFSTGFKAISPSGSLVSGAVTAGFWKGSTIRFD